MGQEVTGLAALLWLWLARPMALSSLGKRRRTRAQVGSETRGGVRSRLAWLL
jgi:hypothetical protein